MEDVLCSIFFVRTSIATTAYCMSLGDPYCSALNLSERLCADEEVVCRHNYILQRREKKKKKNEARVRQNPRKPTPGMYIRSTYIRESRLFVHLGRYPSNMTPGVTEKGHCKAPGAECACVHELNSFSFLEMFVGGR